MRIKSKKFIVRAKRVKVKNEKKMIVFECQYE